MWYTDFVNVSIGLSILVATLSAFRFAAILSRDEPSKQPTGRISARIKYAFWFLFGYYSINFISEVTAWSLADYDVANHYVYAINLMIASAFLFLFFGFHHPDKKFLTLLALVYVLFMFLFFYDSMWHPESMLSFTFVMIYFSCLAIVSIVFFSLKLLTHLKEPNKANISFGILFLTYHFLALIITVFIVYATEDGLFDKFVYYVNMGFIMLFYLVSALLIFRLKRGHYVDH